MSDVQHGLLTDVLLSGGSTAQFVWVQWLLQHATGKIILHKCVLFNITCIGGGILKPFCGLLFQLIVSSISNN